MAKADSRFSPRREDLPPSGGKLEDPSFFMRCFIAPYG